MITKHPISLNSLLTFAVLLLTACAANLPVVVEQNPPPLAPTFTPLPEQVVTVAPASPTQPAASDAEWQSITPPDESVTFELPAAWSHYGQDTAWSPDGGKTIIGLRMGWNRPGQAIETGLLSEGASITETQTEMINKISVRRFRLALDSGSETHLLLVRPDTMVFDFYLHAPTEAEMDDLYPVLTHVVESATFP